MGKDGSGTSLEPQSSDDLAGYPANYRMDIDDDDRYSAEKSTALRQKASQASPKPPQVVMMNMNMNNHRDINDNTSTSTVTDGGGRSLASCTTNRNSLHHQNCTQGEKSNLEKFLNDLTFRDLNEVIPWTPQMEIDAMSVKSNVQVEAQINPPLNEGELTFFRHFMRKQFQGRLLEDEFLPLVHNGTDDADEDVDNASVKNPLHDPGPRGRALRKIKEEELHPTSQLSQDSFSFLISARIRSIPFVFGSIVLVVKALLFSLICINLIDLSSDNPLGIPAGVTPAVAIAQFLAMFITVASQDDLRTALNYYFEGYDHNQLGAAFRGAGHRKWLAAVSLQLFEGAFGIATTFLLIITSDDVVGLVLDFTAVEFITLLDNVAFVLAVQGFMGQSNKTESGIVSNTVYIIRKSRQKTLTFQILMLLGTFLILFVGWLVIYTQQLQGHYMPKSIVVQFDDGLKPELGAYTGLYNLEIIQGRIDKNRFSYVAANKEVETRGFIGYCLEDKFWTFSEDNTNPCQDYVARSSEALSFDILESVGSWSATEDSDLQRYYSMDNFVILQPCDRDRDCGGVGRGACQANQQCLCNEGFYGLRCDYQESEACEEVVVDERLALFRGSRTYSSRYKVLRDGATGGMVQTYHHPVYVADSDNSQGLDVILYTGVRWALFNSLGGMPQIDDHTRDGLADYLQSIDFHAAVHLKSLAFFTDPVIFNTPDDGDSPIGISWYSVLEENLANTAQLSKLDTLLLCAVCDDEENPCQNGNMCGDDGTCLCDNGATGSICQITPVSNGHCDLDFNKASYKYDGGDCCQVTCISTSEHSCGIVSIGVQQNVDQGFPFCADPSIIQSCGRERCWAISSGDQNRVSSKITTLATLSDNGRILAVAAPDLDVVRIYDQDDSRWIQRGPLLAGANGVKFGKTLALSTLPGMIVGRRYGRVPVLLAIGSHGRGKATVRVSYWKTNGIDWRPVGDEIEVCQATEELSVDCDLLAIEIGRVDNRATLVVVRTDNVVLIYYTILSETGSQPWNLTHVIVGLDETAAYMSASLSGSVDMLALSRGELLEVYYQGNDEMDANAFDFENTIVRNATDDIAELKGVKSSVAVNIDSVKLSYEGDSLVCSLSGRNYVIALRYNFYPSGNPPPAFIPLPVAIGNFTASILTPKQVESGLSRIRFSADASSVGVRVNTTAGSRIRVVTLNTTSSSFEPRGVTFADVREKIRSNDALGNDFIDVKGDYGLSYDASAYVQIGEKGQETYRLVPRCPTGTRHYRLSLTLDEHPANTSWSLETYQQLGNITFRDRIIHECNNCYFGDDRFGRSIVAEDVCIPNDDDKCLRVRFHSEMGLRPGAGMVIFKDGKELTRFEDSGIEPSLVVANPESAGACKKNVLSCDSSSVRILVEMEIDARTSFDNSWVLLDGQEDVLSKGGDYPRDDDRTIVLYRICAPQNDTFQFTMLDTAGDGMCCDYGYGGYKVYVENTLVYSLQGERSFNFDRIVFDSNGTLIAKPVPVTLEIQSDNPDLRWVFEYGNEIWWESDSQSDVYSTHTVYLTEERAYTLRVRDSFEYYNLYWGTQVDPSRRIFKSANSSSSDSEEVFISQDSILATPSPLTLAPVTFSPITPVAPITQAPFTMTGTPNSTTNNGTIGRIIP